MPDFNQLYRGRKLRTGRCSETGRIYLVTAVTRQRMPLFADLHCGRMVVKVLQNLEQSNLIDSLAFVVMPDHLHCLFSLQQGTLAMLMQRLKGSSARWINHYHTMPGRQVWQAGYHEHALRKEQDVRAVARYIVANPLRAGLVERIGDYALWDAVWL